MAFEGSLSTIVKAVCQNVTKIRVGQKYLEEDKGE